MRKLKSLILVALSSLCALSSAFALFGCTNDALIKDVPDRWTEEADIIADFRKGASPAFYAANGYSNGGNFGCVWRESCITYNNNALQITFKEDASDYKYAGGELRTHKNYGYGYYSTSMKALPMSGIISSFFTYTGRSEGNPHDEIDVEFMGKDTTEVQLNYYVGGKGGHERILKLGFDAAEEFHEYGFLWEEKKITWFIDGKAVHAVEGDNLPKAHGKIMMNTWNPIGFTQDLWAGKFDASKMPCAAEYEWVAYKPL